MAEEASLPPVISSPVLRDTSHDPGPSSLAGSSYELQDFRQQARDTTIAASDDERGFSAHSQEIPSSSPKRRMSRAPLLVRSSPAQGTGKLMNHLAFRARASLRRRTTSGNVRLVVLDRLRHPQIHILNISARFLRRLADTLVEP
jgi:hypothetical protein